jgi:hypothetical protein
MSLKHILAVLFFALFLGGALGAQMKPPATVTNPAFEQLKSLTGTWEGKKDHDEPVKVTYELVSNGSVLMERLDSANEAEMITMYSLDGSRLVVTHYCSMGNQPTMQTAPLSAATGKYDFHFVRVAGTKTPGEGHMADLTLSLPDKDHLTQVWTFDDHGKTNTEIFTYIRKS